jgi:hypothetical protein
MTADRPDITLEALLTFVKESRGFGRSGPRPRAFWRSPRREPGGRPGSVPHALA